MATRDEMQQIAKEVVEAYVKASEGDVEKGRISEADLLKKLNTNIKSIGKTVTTQAKQAIKDSNNRDKLIEKLQNTVVQKLEKQGVIQQSPQENFLQRIGFKQPTRDDLATQYRARQMAGGIESILEGRFASGLRQLGSTIPTIANFMGGPLYAAMTGLATATIKAIDSFIKFSAVATRLSGSELGTKVSDRYARLRDIKGLSMAYGQNSEDFDKYMMSDIGNVGRRRLWQDRQFTNVWMSTRADFERMGVSPDKVNTLMSQQLSLGRSSDEIRRFNYRLREATKTMDTFSSDKFISSYQELNKTLIANNINGMANAKTLSKFQDQLNKGTLSISDFTKALTSRRGAETSTLAGVGAMLAERGLGGKELLDAYYRGDMIAVAGAVRRGGAQMSRDIEKIAPEISKELGTSDWKEALALQAGTPWGQLTADLKNLQVQNTLVSGGSMVIGSDGKPLKPEDLAKEEQEIKKSESELIDETVKLTGTFKLLKDYIQYNILQKGADIEKEGIAKTLSNAALNALMPGKQVIEAVFKIGNPTQT